MIPAPIAHTTRTLIIIIICILLYSKLKSFKGEGRIFTGRKIIDAHQYLNKTQFFNPLPSAFHKYRHFPPTFLLTDSPIVYPFSITLCTVLPTANIQQNSIPKYFLQVFNEAILKLPSHTRTR